MQTAYHLANLLGIAALSGGLGLVLGFAWGLESASEAQAVLAPLNLGELPPAEEVIAA